MNTRIRPYAAMLSLAIIAFVTGLVGSPSVATARPICPLGEYWDGEMCVPNEPPPDPPPPTGWVGSVERRPDALRVVGWVRPSSGTGAVTVDMTDNGQVVVAGITANIVRSDVGAYGFDTMILASAVPGGLPPANHVCVQTTDGASVIACTDYSLAVNPFGNLESASQSGAGIVKVSGWALDPDTASPIGVHLYVDGTFATGTSAGVDHHDQSSGFAGYGGGHGFDTVVTTATGTHSVCAYGINVGAGQNWQLGNCRTVQVNGLPVAPTGLSLAPRDTGILVSWNQDPVNTVDGVTLERQQTDGSWLALPVPSSPGGGTKSYDDGGLTAGTTYSYRVRNWNAYGTSPNTQASTTTLLARIAAPTGLTVGSATTSTVTLTWSDNATDEDGYTVRLPNGTRLAAGSRPGTGPMSYVVTGLSAGTSYCFDVWAVKAGHQPSDSAHACGSTVAAPRVSYFTAAPTQVQQCETKSIYLQWSVTNTSHLMVFRGTETSPILDARSPLPSSFTDPLPQSGGLTYKLVAYGPDGVTTASATTTVTKFSTYTLAKSLTVKNNTAPAGATTGELIRVQQYNQKTGALLADTYVAVGNSTTFTLSDCLFTYVRIHRMSSGGTDYISATYLGSPTGIAATETFS